MMGSLRLGIFLIEDSKKNSFTNIVAYTKGLENISNQVKYSLTLNLKNLTVFIFNLCNQNYYNFKKKIK